MQPHDLGGVVAPGGGELGGRVGPRRQATGRARRGGRARLGGPQRPAEPAQHGRVVGQGVRAAQLAQLEQVLHRAQEPVGGGQAGGVGPAHVAAVGQRRQRGQGGRAADGVVAAAVHQLQQLHRELDVAQARRDPA